MKLRDFFFCVNLMPLVPGAASAHVSEQGFVLLLPTEAYTAAGVAAVVLTVLALFVVPATIVHTMFRARSLRSRDWRYSQTITSLMSLLVMVFAVYIGLTGSRDPLSNLMPLGFWTVGWIALVSLAGLFGNLWAWINPWTGLYRLIGPITPVGRLPNWLGLWPATGLLVGFAAFLLADIAPDDPTRLARFVLMYWGITFGGLVLFGPKWLTHCELGQAIFAAYASLAPVRLGVDGGIGGPGWRVISDVHMRAAGIFALMLLAVGSFDGMNETYWWLGQIGVNPLEFPGRSAVVRQTLLGLGLAIACLFAVFGVTVWLGLLISRERVGFQSAFGRLALSVLPIALVYHMAHYLTSFMVSIQYTVAALSDPFAVGADFLGLEPFRVTTGFFNSIDTVWLIWMTQAGLVVVGHIWSVLLSHRIALSLFANERRAALATLPLSLFMIGYTLLGLWLLAAPKGA